MDGISRRAFIQNATVLAGSMATARLGRAQCSLPGCSAAPGSGEAILKFNGTTGYVEVPSHPGLSPSTTGQFSLQVWIRPDTLTFPKSESSGYVMWAGKGDVSGHSGNQEYGFRMYNLVNADNPPNR